MSVEQPAEDTGDPPAAKAHPEPAHNVGQDLGVSVEQLADDTGDPGGAIELKLYAQNLLQVPSAKTGLTFQSLDPSSVKITTFLSRTMCASITRKTSG